MGAGLDARASRGAPPANGPPGGAGFPRLVDARSFILRSLRSSAHDISGCSSRASSSSVHRSSSSTIAVGGEETASLVDTVLAAAADARTPRSDEDRSTH